MYRRGFYKHKQKLKRSSAETIVPLLLELVSPRVSSVVDIGCDIGTWLTIFKEKGVEEILGIDGSWIRRSDLEIPNRCFMSKDLCQPIELGRTFDLALSLEVAEHLPESCASQFVASLTRLAPVIAFSAAVPFQGGTHHLNKPWPQDWADLFVKQGYAVIDAIRPRVWNDKSVYYCYAQNLIIFCS